MPTELLSPAAAAAPAAGAMPLLPRSAARLSICFDFPGYMQLLQAQGHLQHYVPGARRDAGQGALSAGRPPGGGDRSYPPPPPGERSYEIRCSADHGSSILLPGCARGSRSAFYQASSSGLFTRAERGRQLGSVDGAAEAEVLTTWELSQGAVCAGSPPSATRERGRATAAAAASAAAASSAAMTAVARLARPDQLQPLHSPGPLGGGGDSKASVPQQEHRRAHPLPPPLPQPAPFSDGSPTAPTAVEREPAAAATPTASEEVGWNFSHDLQSERARVRSAVVYNRGHIQYDEKYATTTAAACCDSAPFSRSLPEPNSSAAVAAAGGSASTRSRSSPTGSERGTTTAGALWHLLTSLTERTRRAVRGSESAGAGGTSPSPSTAEVRHQPRGAERTAMSSLGSTGRQTAGGDHSTGVGHGPPIGLGMTRAPSAPMVGDRLVQGGVGGLDVVTEAAAAMSLSSSIIGTVGATPTSPAATAVDGRSGRAAAGGTSPGARAGAAAVRRTGSGGAAVAAAGPEGGALGESLRRTRSRRSWMSGISWLKCVQCHARHVGSASDRYGTQYDTSRTPSFTALNNLVLDSGGGGATAAICSTNGARGLPYGEDLSWVVGTSSADPYRTHSLPMAAVAQAPDPWVSQHPPEAGLPIARTAAVYGPAVAAAMPHSAPPAGTKQSRIARRLSSIWPLAVRHSTV